MVLLYFYLILTITEYLKVSKVLFSHFPDEIMEIQNLPHLPKVTELVNEETDLV